MVAVGHRKRNVLAVDEADASLDDGLCGIGEVIAVEDHEVDFAFGFGIIDLGF